MTEKKKFFTKIKDKRSKGLLHIGFAFSGIPAESLEEIYAELNRMDEAPDEDDPELC